MPTREVYGTRVPYGLEQHVGEAGARVAFQSRRPGARRWLEPAIQSRRAVETRSHARAARSGWRPRSTAAGGAGGGHQGQIQHVRDAGEHPRRVRSDEQWKLGRTRALLDLAGAPDRQLRVVLVAGTKGKSSTCAMLASILGA